MPRAANGSVWGSGCCSSQSYYALYNIGEYQRVGSVRPHPELWPIASRVIVSASIAALLAYLHFVKCLSLRSLLVVVSMFGLLCGWLTYHIRWIQQRHAAFNQFGTICGHERDRYTDPPFSDHGTARGVSVSPPWSLRLLGETGIATIVLCVDDKPANEQDAAQRIKSLFPEATVLTAFPPIN